MGALATIQPAQTPHIEATNTNNVATPPADCPEGQYPVEVINGSKRENSCFDSTYASNTVPSLQRDIAKSHTVIRRMTTPVT